MNAPGRFPTVMTSREFNLHRGKAMQAAKDGPVSITHRGRPAYVLISAEEYERLKGPALSAWEALAPEQPIDLDLDGHLPAREIEPDRFDFDPTE